VTTEGNEQLWELQSLNENAGPLGCSKGSPRVLPLLTGMLTISLGNAQVDPDPTKLLPPPGARAAGTTAEVPASPTAQTRGKPGSHSPAGPPQPCPGSARPAPVSYFPFVPPLRLTCRSP
jgi:hypothetical protein